MSTYVIRRIEKLSLASFDLGLATKYLKDHFSKAVNFVDLVETWVSVNTIGVSSDGKRRLNTVLLRLIKNLCTDINYSELKLLHVYRVLSTHKAIDPVTYTHTLPLAVDGLRVTYIMDLAKALHELKPINQNQRTFREELNWVRFAVIEKLSCAIADIPSTCNETTFADLSYLHKLLDFYTVGE